MAAIFKKNSIHHLVLLQGVVLAKQHPQRSLSASETNPFYRTRSSNTV